MNFADRLIVPAMRQKGRMPNSRIYAAVHARARAQQIHLSANWRSTVRNTLQRYCAKNPKFMGTARFIHRKRGVWECL